MTGREKVVLVEIPAPEKGSLLLENPCTASHPLVSLVCQSWRHQASPEQLFIEQLETAQKGKVMLFWFTANRYCQHKHWTMFTEDLLQKLNLIIKPLFFQEKLSLVKCHQKKPQMTCMSVKARECHLVPVRKFGEQQDKVHLCSQNLIFPNSHTSHFQHSSWMSLFAFSFPK